MLNKAALCAVAAIILLGAAQLAGAQELSMGVVGGFGIATRLSAELPTGTSAKAGVRPGVAAGLFFRDDMYANLSGEFRYLYRSGAHKVSSDTGSAQLGAHSHLYHYDLLFHTGPADGPSRVYAAVGFGGRTFQGTGTPPRTQPLGNLVLLRKASETQPMISLGGGVRWRWGASKVIQFDVRDYMTPAPRRVFAPSATSTVSGWIHDFVPQISIGVTF